MATTDAFHTYRIEIPANGSAVQLFVDGVLRYSGAGYASVASSQVWWGDGTPTGGNGKADWDYVRVWK